MRFFPSLLSKFGEVGEITKKFGNFPEAYVKKCVTEVEWQTPRGLPQYLPKKIVHRKRNFTVHSPWSPQFAQENARNVRKPKIFVEPYRNWSFFVGDRVELLTGPDKGKQGTIIQVIQERNFVIVEGLNCKLKSMGKKKNHPGVVMQDEQPLLVQRDVKLVDPSDLKGTDIEWRYTEDGQKVRVSARTGRIIPIPKQAEATYDYKTKGSYVESPKDTVSKELKKMTFEPKLETFEMSIMKSMGIKEDRIPSKTYWF